ncbi:MAG: hypothetical protein HWN68_17385 [Desulfobacterales bacterium]|nr:hypothetical protein [Desulfobacterales bacterium]
MKKLKKDLQAVVKELNALIRKSEVMANKVDKLDKAQAAKAKTTRKAAAKKKAVKAPAKKRSVKAPVKKKTVMVPVKKKSPVKKKPVSKEAPKRETDNILFRKFD